MRLHVHKIANEHSALLVNLDHTCQVQYLFRFYLKGQTFVSNNKPGIIFYDVRDISAHFRQIGWPFSLIQIDCRLVQIKPLRNMDLDLSHA